MVSGVVRKDKSWRQSWVGSSKRWRVKAYGAEIWGVDEVGWMMLGGWYLYMLNVDSPNWTSPITSLNSCAIPSSCLATFSTFWLHTKIQLHLRHNWLVILINQVMLMYTYILVWFDYIIVWSVIDLILWNWKALSYQRNYLCWFGLTSLYILTCAKIYNSPILKKRWGLKNQKRLWATTLTKPIYLLGVALFV